MRKSKVERHQVGPEELQERVTEFMRALAKRLEKHGRGVFIGKMEAQGAVTEEWKELVDACQEGDIDQVKKEGLDVAVAGFWTYVSAFDFPEHGGDRDESRPSTTPPAGAAGASV